MPTASLTKRAFLVEEEIRREEGVSPTASVPEAALLRITLGITRIVERESLDVVIESADADGEDWKPVLDFSQKFYCGAYRRVLDLTGRPGLRVIRARWRMCRWHTSGASPLFSFYIAWEEMEAPVRAMAAAG
ncbi:MAG: hypothetical protein R2762_03345 [Bryobacteraceae bacterium]